MLIEFKSSKLEKQLTEPSRTQKDFGVLAKKITQRLREISSATCLADLSHLPPMRCHKLTGNREGSFAVDIGERFRIVFEPNHDPIPKLDDGGFDLKAITAVTIISVENYH